jgi:hypothetical protein
VLEDGRERPGWLISLCLIGGSDILCGDIQKGLGVRARKKIWYCENVMKDKNLVDSGGGPKLDTI